LEDQLTFITTFSLNSNQKSENLAFLESKDLQENIGIFNKNLEKNIAKDYSKNDIWYF
jgi:hypothetical protein